FSCHCLHMFYNSSCSYIPSTDRATPKISTLSLHDALPIYQHNGSGWSLMALLMYSWAKQSGHEVPPLEDYLDWGRRAPFPRQSRSEEHTSELQSRRDLVCRLLLEKKNNSYKT